MGLRLEKNNLVKEGKYSVDWDCVTGEMASLIVTMVGSNMQIFLEIGLRFDIKKQKTVAYIGLQLATSYLAGKIMAIFGFSEGNESLNSKCMISRFSCVEILN